MIDFFRNSPGTSSQLGTVLADGFSESLASYSAGKEILDRKALRNYLVENWTTLEDLRSNEIGLGVVPPSEAARRFVDEIGRMHQRLALACEHVTLMVAGVEVAVKRAP